MRTLRLEGESDAELRLRVARSARIARCLVNACLANWSVQRLIADPANRYTAEWMRQSPFVRLEYDEATCFAGIGEGLAACKNKHWGEGPQIMPLQPDDFIDGMFITYRYKESSRYNRRFEQRMRLKELLGRRFRPLVERAKYGRHTQAMFLADLKEDERQAIERRIGVSAVEFWRACRGTHFIDLPGRTFQLDLFEEAPLP